MAPLRRSLAAKVAVASAAVVLPVAASASAGDTGSWADFPGHQVLSAPGGVLTLRDGRQVRARTVGVGGCATRRGVATGTAHPDAARNYTTMSRRATARVGSARECVTGVPTDAGAARYTSFQAFVVETNGFRFTPSFVLEDVGAQPDARRPSEGWRETMTSLGAAGGTLVHPQLSTAEDALVGVRRFGMPAASLAEVGLPVSSGLTIDGVAYLAEEPTNCPFLKDYNSRCKAFVKFTEPVDKLVIIYAITQGSLSDRTSKAFFSQLMLTCGCQCASIRPAPGATKVVPVGDGKCEVVEDTSSHHRCDYMGGHWCDTVTSARYVFTGKDQSCGRQPSVVQRQLSTYEPSKSFGRVPT